MVSCFLIEFNKVILCLIREMNSVAVDQAKKQKNAAAFLRFSKSSSSLEFCVSGHFRLQKSSEAYPQGFLKVHQSSRYQSRIKLISRMRKKLEQKSETLL